MKTRLFLLILVLISNGLIAQQPLNNADKKHLLDLVSNNSNKTKSLVSSFKEVKHIGALNNVVVSKGELLYLAPDNIKWKYLTPISNTTIIKGDKLYNLSNKGNNTIDLEKNKLFRKFNTLIINSINGDLFDETLFNIQYFKSDTAFLVLFEPKDNRIKKLFTTIEIQFDIQTADVLTIKLVERNEDFTSIEFYDRKTNVSIDAQEFKI